MSTFLRRAYNMAESHVVSCLLCSGKGFVCELCSRLPPVYPFHLERISQCARCFTVFHVECAKEQQDRACPRCERKEARNLNWHVGDVRSRRERRLVVDDVYDENS